MTAQRLLFNHEFGCFHRLFYKMHRCSAEARTQETGDEERCRMGQDSLLIRPSLRKPLMAFEKPCGGEQELLSHNKIKKQERL